MKTSADFLVVGGGLAGATAIKTMLSSGVPGTRMTLVAAERELPYHRPPLSKGYLLERVSRDSLFVKPRNFYAHAGVQLLLGSKAVAVNTSARTVTTDNAGTIGYGKLLLATGGTLRRLTVPGADLLGISYLRTLADADTLRETTQRAKTAVVVGGSFIGMELAAAFAQKGLATTLLHRGTAVFDKLGSPEASAFFAQYFAERGVTIRTEDEATAFTQPRPGGGPLEVQTKRGDTLGADIVAVGVGVTPNTEFLASSGIALENGVQVNEYLEASVPDVYAAGDIAHFFDPLYQRHRRIEHWDTAIQHGNIAGANMIGKRLTYNMVSYFFSDVFDLTFEYFGDAAETDRTVRRGSFAEKSVTLFFLQGAVVRSAFTLGRPKERKALIALIRNQVEIPRPDELSRPATALPTA